MIQLAIERQEGRYHDVGEEYVLKHTFRVSGCRECYF